MKDPQSGRSPSGFTLIEMLVVLALLMILMLFAVPALMTSMRQGKIRGITNQTANLMRLARLEAIRRSCQTIVKMDETDPPRMEGFTDCDKDGVADADLPTLGSFPLPNGVRFLAPPNLEGKDSVEGLSVDPGGGAANVAIFLPNGSIQGNIPGGFRFGDESGNFLEVWVDPPATARIEIHKCLLCTDATNRADWYAAGDGGKAWEWK
jgi:prepilin-type N-terminal cleavage/methylation domain-containing protein